MPQETIILTIDTDSVTATNFNIYLSESLFQSHDIVNLYEEFNISKPIPAILIPNQLNNTDSSKTVTITDNSITLIPTKSYIIEIFRSDALLVSTKFSVPAISDYEVITYGDRIITILSKFPIKNWLSEETVLTPFIKDDITTASEYTALSNFYALYYGEDINTALLTGQAWGGFFPIADKTNNLPSAFTARVSNNSMTLEIQCNLRSLPNTESNSHKLIINYSKAQKAIKQNKQIDLTKVLVDFANNDLLIKEKIFTISKALEPSKATNIEIDSRNKITISYDKPICLISTELSNIITIGNENFSAESAERIGNQFNKISYSLNEKLPLGDNVLITANAITDASGFKTQIVSPFSRKIIGTPPKFKSITQISTENNETVLTLTFNTSMNTTAATDINNYLLIDTGFNSSLIEQIKSIVAISPNTFTITTTPLPLGSYRLNAIRNIPDSDGDAMILPEYIDFEIVDLTIPKVLAIYAPLSSRKNLNSNSSKLVIIYDTVMNKNSINGADNSSNYRFDIYSDPIITPIDSCNTSIEKQLLLDNVTITDLKDSKWFTIPLTSIKEDLIALNDNMLINIGFCGLNYIRNIANISGNLYPLCCPTKITGWLDSLDISDPKTELKITSPNELLLTYPLGYHKPNSIEYNYFTKVDKDDFIILINQVPHTAESAILQDNMKSIIFKLNSNISLSTQNSISIKAKEIVKNTRDLFGDLIIPNVSTPLAINKMPPQIISATLESIYTGYEATINLLFDKELSNPNKNDFTIFNNGEQLAIISATIKSYKKDTVQLKVPIGEFNNSDNVNFIVSSINNPNLIETGTINGTKIQIFKNEVVQQYKIINISWIPQASTSNNLYNLSKNSFIVKFSSPVNFATINDEFLTNDSYTISNVSVNKTTTPNLTGIDIYLNNDTLGKITISTAYPATIQSLTTTVLISKNCEDSIIITLADIDVLIDQIPRDARLILDSNSNIMNKENTLYLNKSYIPISTN